MTALEFHPLANIFPLIEGRNLPTWSLISASMDCTNRLSSTKTKS
jgi:hypothetical protein